MYQFRERNNLGATLKLIPSDFNYICYSTVKIIDVSFLNHNVPTDDIIIIDIK